MRPDRKFAERVAVPVDASIDRLWQLPPGLPRLGHARQPIVDRGLVSKAAIEQSQKGCRQRSATVREARSPPSCARRWP